MLHALSIDVEDWYHDVPGGSAANGDSRVERNMDTLLELLAPHGARATCFFVGDLASRFPRLVQRVLALGHEVGSHGYAHRHVGELTRHEFREDVVRSIATIEDAAGQAVRGYRAPYFSLKADVRWPMQILREAGVLYDSSVLAIDRPPGLELVCPRTPFRHANGLWEVPVAVWQLLHFWHLPLASGAGLRLLPRGVFDRCLRRFERDVGPGVFYLHPWELDPASPTGPGFGRALLRVGRRQLAGRLGALLQRVRFAPIIEVFAEQLSSDERKAVAVRSRGT